MWKVMAAVITAVLCVISAYTAYVFTKDNYMDVGKNYGDIDAKIEVFKEIKKQLPALKTCSSDQMKTWKLLVSAKTLAVFTTPVGDSSLAFCSAE
jgi:hypothetical protein